MSTLNNPAISRLTNHPTIAALKDRWSTRPTWPQGFAGAYLGMGARDPVFGGPEHSALVIGPPRSGKTASIVIPAVTLWPGPAVITSTKPDVVSTTTRCRSKAGRVWVLDPTGTVTVPDGAIALRWSPLLGCGSWDTAIDRAWMLTASARPNPSPDAQHWTERAAALLAPLLHAAATKGLKLDQVVEWVHRRETWKALDLLSANPSSAVAHDVLAGIANTDPRELSGIWSTADGILAAYRSTATLDAACRPNFDPEAFVHSNDTVHVVTPATRAQQHVPIVCSLLDQIRHHALARQAPWPPMLWALDEAATIAPLPTLPGIVADAGSQGLLVLACLQDLSQARHRWGSQADGFLTLFATTVLMPGVADRATLETVTLLSGKVDRPQYSFSHGRQGGQRTTSTRPLPLLPENVIAHGRTGHALVLRATHPAWLRLTPWHSTPWIRRLVECQRSDGRRRRSLTGPTPRSGTTAGTVRGSRARDPGPS